MSARASLRPALGDVQYPETLKRREHLHEDPRCHRCKERVSLEPGTLEIIHTDTESAHLPVLTQEDIDLVFWRDVTFKEMLQILMTMDGEELNEPCCILLEPFSC